MGRKPKDPGAMLEMAAPDILAKMEAPEAPKQRRMRRSRGFEKAQTQAGRAKPVEVKPEPIVGDPFAEARRPTRGYVWKVGELNDYKTLTPLPANGKCTCNSKPYTWTNVYGVSQSKRNPDIGYFCSHVEHGGNGRFWLFSDNYKVVGKRRGRPPKAK